MRPVTIALLGPRPEIGRPGGKPSGFFPKRVHSEAVLPFFGFAAPGNSVSINILMTSNMILLLQRRRHGVRLPGRGSSRGRSCFGPWGLTTGGESTWHEGRQKAGAFSRLGRPPWGGALVVSRGCCWPGCSRRGLRRLRPTMLKSRSPARRIELDSSSRWGALSGSPPNFNRTWRCLTFEPAEAVSVFRPSTRSPASG